MSLQPQKMTITTAIDDEYLSEEERKPIPFFVFDQNKVAIGKVSGRTFTPLSEDDIAECRRGGFWYRCQGELHWKAY